ncbi:MAG TPA: hypothetical protein VE526_00825 [Solirubrobacteraceae bacterium]|nr:hypothetical protein [Solirubrobacteraceae bacterium]
MTKTPRLRHAVLAAGLALAVLPTAAAADSIVFVKDANVWLASGDGSKLHQVTTDGTAADPYRVPVQADDGTIAASHGQAIVRLRQNGEVIGTIDPGPLTNSVGQPVDGPPVNLAISPDGSRIAYTLVGFSCPVGADCGARPVTAYTAADALTPASRWGAVHRRNPSFVTDSRALVFGGYLGQVNTHDLGDAAEVHWFDDQDIYGQADATDLGDGELNRQGSRLAAVRGYGADTHVIWYDVSGDAATQEPPALPQARCKTGKEAGLHGPTWSPDGESLAIGSADGIWVKRGVGSCDSPAPVLLLPGGSQPDWGPADVNPQPRTGPATDPGTGPGTGPAPAPGPGGAPAITVAGAKARTVARRGLPVRVSCAAACAIRVQLRVKALRGVVASATGSAAAGATVTLTLRPKPAVRRKLARMRGAKATVKVVVDGAAPITRKLTLG